jgi:hypothetical protein
VVCDSKVCSLSLERVMNLVFEKDLRRIHELEEAP